MLLLFAWSARGLRALDSLPSIVLLEDSCFAVSYSGGHPERFFHNLDGIQTTTQLLKMQPNLSNSRSGLPYRKTVKRYFRRIKRFYLSVSVYESASCDLFLAFLTDGNKSKCGTRLNLTHPQQSTDSPILEPVSPAKRQVPQGKPFTLSSARPQTSPHRHMPRATPRAIRPITRPRHAPHHTPASHPHPTRSHTITTPKSHAIPEQE